MVRCTPIAEDDAFANSLEPAVNAGKAVVALAKGERPSLAGWRSVALRVARVGAHLYENFSFSESGKGNAMQSLTPLSETSSRLSIQTVEVAAAM